MRKGYFWDPLTGRPFIARGIAYQSWNPPVGANQSFAQLDYDLREFKKMYANSVRCEMVWNEVQRGPNNADFDWRKPDFLVDAAEKHGLKLFVLIGFQYAPDWSPEDWHAVNDQDKRSVVLSYENPDARLSYSNYIAQVTARYKDSPAIGAWILGNEYAYFDLWEPMRRYLGYDQYSLASFRAYLRKLYGADIAALNAIWKTSYASFDAVEMPRSYPADRNFPGFHDLLQWRKQSIGEYVAFGAVAAKLHDPNHLRTYSMIGGLFGEADVHYTCEDGKTIVKSCADAGAPLHFWAINNYAIAALDTELRSADYGIGKHQAAAGLPVMISETGHTSTEDLHPGAAERQAAALPGQMWEALMSGAIGTHIFTWNDRNFFTTEYFGRERGFGIVQENRLPKDPVYENCLEMFRRMEQLDIDNLLADSTNPPTDILFFWSLNSDLGWSRANHENIRLWSTLKRLGFQPGIINDDQFDAGQWRTAKALLLSRAFQLDPRHLDAIASEVVGAGVHVHADADLPGQFNAYHQPNPNWAQRMSTLFGLNVSRAVPGWDAGSNDPNDMFRLVRFTGVNPLGPLVSGYSDLLGTWKIWHGLRASSGTTVVRHKGLGDVISLLPALQIKTLGSAKTAINTFGLGDTTDDLNKDTAPAPHSWKVRYDWLRAIYRNHFGLTPTIDLSGTGAEYVFPDHRVLRNGSVLLSFLNGHTNRANVSVSAAGLIAGKTVEDLTAGGIVEANSDGVLQLELAADQYVLLYAFNSSGGAGESLINLAPEKIWFVAAPTAVWPNGKGYDVALGYDTRGAAGTVHVSFERVGSPNKQYGRATGMAVAGRGTTNLPVPIPDADLNDPDYLSSREGGQYVFHAWFERNGVRTSDTFLPVRLVWPVRPVGPLPTNIVPGQTYTITLEWQELPSYLHPGSTLDRADLWESLQANAEHYQVVLELRGKNGEVLASANALTSTGTASQPLAVRVPAGAQGPFTWSAFVRAAPGVLSHDIVESFEGRTRGAMWVCDDTGKRERTLQYDRACVLTTNVLAGCLDLNCTFIAPWASYTYAFPEANLWQNQGVQLQGTDGSQSAFLVMFNPAGRDVSTCGISLRFPDGEWALPTDRNEWSSFVFSYDFKEEHTFDCLVEMQIKNDDPTGSGKWLEFSKRYVPGPDKWDTVRASLKDFNRPPNLPGVFDPLRVREVVVNIRLLTPGVQYVASIDNIRFDGPDLAQSFGETYGVFSSGNDFFGLNRAEFDPVLGELTLRWLAGGTLQEANDLSGPWRSLLTATSPFTVRALDARKFYRLSK